VASVTAQTMRSFEGVDEERLVVGFENKAKKLPLNRSQASVFVRLFGDDTETWLGKQVQLSPAESRQPGKLTIAVTGVATAEGGALPF
jgi:hypothetical protein